MAESLTVSFRVRVSEGQLKDIKYLAEYSQSSVGSIAREACRLYCEKTAYLKILKQILNGSKIGDTKPIVFPGSWNQDSKNKIKVYVHNKAFNELENLGKKTGQEVMEFFDASIRDGSILHKGQITTTDEGINFICFRVNLVKVYCYFASMQITILSVVK